MDRVADIGSERVVLLWVSSEKADKIRKVPGDQHHHAEEWCASAYRVTWQPLTQVSLVFCKTDDA